MKYTTGILKTLVVRDNCKKFYMDMQIRPVLFADKIMSTVDIREDHKKRIRHEIIMGMQENWYRFYELKGLLEPNSCIIDNVYPLYELYNKLCDIITEGTNKWFYWYYLEEICRDIRDAINNESIDKIITNERVPYGIPVGNTEL